MFFFNVIKPHHILVAREDAMGDVILALPVCGLIKKYYPSCKVTFLGRTYTKSIALTSIYVDEFLNYDEWHNKSSGEITDYLKAQKIDTVIHLVSVTRVLKECWNAKIKLRVGGTNKLPYWLYCNRLIPFSRKRARLSESQLNIKLLRAINIKERPQRNEVYKYYGFTNIAALDNDKQHLIDPEKFNIILHPLSNKNAKEWGLQNFSALIKLIERKNFKIFITGSEKEKELLSPWLQQHKNEVTDLTGMLNTDQLIAFIAATDGLIASSTGPIHIAAAAGIQTLGLYEDKWTKRGERWGPIGKNADFIQCINKDMNTITPIMVYTKIKEWTTDKQTKRLAV